MCSPANNRRIEFSFELLGKPCSLSSTSRPVRYHGEIAHRSPQFHFISKTPITGYFFNENVTAVKFPTGPDFLGYLVMELCGFLIMFDHAANVDTYFHFYYLLKTRNDLTGTIENVILRGCVCNVSGCVTYRTSYGFPCSLI